MYVIIYLNHGGCSILKAFKTFLQYVLPPAIILVNFYGNNSQLLSRTVNLNEIVFITTSYYLFVHTPRAQFIGVIIFQKLKRKVFQLHF